MSEISGNKALHIETVDVVISKENGSLYEITNHSGVDTYDSSSAVCHLSSDSEGSPIKLSETISKDVFVKSVEQEVENESSSSNCSPVSISPDNVNHIESLINCDESPVHENEHISSTEERETTKSCLKEIMTGPVTKLEDHMNKDESDENSLLRRGITISTTSLDEHMSQTNVNSAICKSPFSRSAENISVVEPSIETLNSCTKELNTEEILAEFSSQKSKVSATQKIPDSQTTLSLDVRYPRLPKEILHQDLGSIVKNVHGIFSSVSGSLKSAYNNSHRVLPHQKVPVKLVKNVPNGKVMKEIFEDDVEEKLQVASVEKTNDVDNPNLNSGLNSENECEDVKGDVLKMQVESLEKLLADQRKENSVLKERVKQQSDELQEKDNTFKELEVKLDLMGKRVEQAEREKDAAVMRYASVECAAIEAKRAADKATAAEKAAVAEMELLNGKLKSAHVEKNRICQMYDDKCHELSNSEREVSRMREELKEFEGRLKWTQSKLRMEMDAYKESSERAEKLSQQVTELEAAKEVAIANATDSVKAKQLESELKEVRASLILCRHEREDLEKRLSCSSQQLEICARERDGYRDCLATTNIEVEKLKMSNLRLEEEAAELAALRAQAALADTLSAQLTRETERASKAEEALMESRALAETCARREALALEHSAKLTAQHVAERAHAQMTDSKAQALTADNASLRERVAALEAECTKLTAALSEETDRRNKENRQMARKVAELTEELAEANKNLEWEKGENVVLKKKHSSVIKELNRELQRATKRCEQLEAKITADEHSTRTGSVTSLSSGESAPVEERLQNGHEALPDIQVREPDRQALIERIVSLQRAAARRSERCEFLEEHSKQLTSELRAKSRLLRQLLSSMPAGAVTSPNRDLNKEEKQFLEEHSKQLTSELRAKSRLLRQLLSSMPAGAVTSPNRDLNKKEMARLGGGAMAAVWGGSSDGMTLELSLEMNRRLQAVLEDALLKNITLKENMDTLGAEISRLKEQMKPEQK